MNKPLRKETRSRMVLLALTAGFLMLAAGFVLDLWGRVEPVRPIPPVDPSVLDTQPWRTSYADLLAAEEDVTHFNCYLCHEEDKAPEITFDDKGHLVLPDEHSDLVMAHGASGRINQCYNCHSDANLTLLQAQNGKKLELQDSTPLCASCHTPVYEDWKSGSHGRTSGYWDRSAGPIKRLDCVNCHDPHAPQFPGRAPAPGPNYLRKSPAPNPSDH